MRRILTAFSCLALVALAGCAQGGTKTNSSASKFSGDEKLVANVVEDFQSNATADSGSKICATLITAELAKQITAKNPSSSCAVAVTTAMKATDEADLTVTEVTIDPKDVNKATAAVSAKVGDKSTRKYSFTFTRTDKRWQISSFG